MFLVTYTFPHDRENADAGMLSEVRGRLAEVLRAHKAHRDFRDLTQAVGHGGTIRGFEVTYGELNGWDRAYP